MQQNLLFLSRLSYFSWINTLICCQPLANFRSSEKVDSDHRFCQHSHGFYGRENSQRSSLCYFCWWDTQLMFRSHVNSEETRLHGPEASCLPATPGLGIAKLLILLFAPQAGLNQAWWGVPFCPGVGARRAGKLPRNSTWSGCLLASWDLWPPS